MDNIIDVPIIQNVTNSDKKKHKGLGPKKRNMLGELAKSLGIVTDACRAMNIPRQTHYRWYRDDPIYREAVDELEERKQDVIEKAFLSLVLDKNPQAVIHAVKTKLKHRGYMEKNEIDITSHGQQIQIIIPPGVQKLLEDEKLRADRQASLRLSETDRQNP